MSDLVRFAAALEHARKKYPLMTIGTLATFLAIVTAEEEEEVGPTALAKRLNLPFTTVYRQCDQLADGIGGAGGMKLIKKSASGSDGRSREVSATVSGLMFMRDLRALLTDAPEV